MKTPRYRVSKSKTFATSVFSAGKQVMLRGFVVLLVLFELLEFGSAEPRSPVPEQLQYLEEPDRGEWQMPERVIDALGLQESDVVADVGAGTGYFSRRFAPR